MARFLNMHAYRSAEGYYRIRFTQRTGMDSMELREFWWLRPNMMMLQISNNFGIAGFLYDNKWAASSFLYSGESSGRVKSSRR